jgi:2-phosphoglycerate kinase
LIGGAPTVGKTYSAKKIADYFNLPWTSTDIVRTLMRHTVNEKDYPNIFYFTKTKAVKYLTNHSAKEIVDHQNLESLEVWRGAKAIIEHNYVWDSFIIEGVAILPNLVNKLSVKNKKIIPIFLVNQSVDQIHKVVFERGLWDDANKYPDSVKDKEVEWVRLFNDYIIKEAKKYGYPVINISDNKNYIDEIKNLVK